MPQMPLVFASKAPYSIFRIHITPDAQAWCSAPRPLAACLWFTVACSNCQWVDEGHSSVHVIVDVLGPALSGGHISLW